MDCPTCLQPLTKDLILLDCPKGHVMHYQCVVQVILLSGQKKCQFCFVKIRKGLHQDGPTVILPPIDTAKFPNTCLAQLKCQICHQATRDKHKHGLDKVVCCDGCDEEYVHKGCWLRKYGRKIDMNANWYGANCRQYLKKTC